MRVVDASALVTLVAGRDQATRDELGLELTGHELHVPEHTGAEVLSAIRGLRLGGKISEAIALQALADYAAMPLRHHRAAPFFPRAWQLRHAMTARRASGRGPRRRAKLGVSSRRPAGSIRAG